MRRFNFLLLSIFLMYDVCFSQRVLAQERDHEKKREIGVLIVWLLSYLTPFECDLVVKEIENRKILDFGDERLNFSRFVLVWSCIILLCARRIVSKLIRRNVARMLGGDHWIETRASYYKQNEKINNNGELIGGGIIDAIKKNDTEVVRYFVDKELYTKERYELCSSILGFAIYLDKWECFDILLEKYDLYNSYNLQQPHIYYFETVLTCAIYRMFSAIIEDKYLGDNPFKDFRIDKMIEQGVLIVDIENRNHAYNSFIFYLGKFLSKYKDNNEKIDILYEYVEKIFDRLSEKEINFVRERVLFQQHFVHSLPIQFFKLANNKKLICFDQIQKFNHLNFCVSNMVTDGKVFNSEKLVYIAQKTKEVDWHSTNSSLLGVLWINKKLTFDNKCFYAQNLIDINPDIIKHYFYNEYQEVNCNEQKELFAYQIFLSMNYWRYYPEDKKCEGDNCQIQEVDIPVEQVNQSDRKLAVAYSLPQQ